MIVMAPVKSGVDPAAQACSWQTIKLAAHKLNSGLACDGQRLSW
jgi:hypothetical protein